MNSLDTFALLVGRRFSVYIQPRGTAVCVAATRDGLEFEAIGDDINDAVAALTVRIRELIDELQEVAA